MNRICRVAIAAITLSLCAQAAQAQHTRNTDPDAAFEALIQGNERFSQGLSVHPNTSPERFRETARGQNPFVTVIASSDSRVPVERLFDQGVGDIFTIRVAGNVADTDEIGSIEYGVGHLKTPLLVVLGNSSCGVVTAVAQGAELHGSIPALVDNIKPAINAVKAKNPDLSGDAFIAACVEQNVWQTISDLVARSGATRARLENGKLRIVGAIYDLDTGGVKWLGEHPDMAALLAKPMANAHGSHGASALTPGDQKQLPNAAVISDGTYHQPPFTTTQYADFGAEFGQATAFEHKEAEASLPYTMIQLFWILAGVSLIITVFMTVRFMKIDRKYVGDAQGLTIGSKLMLGFGVLTTIMFSTTAIAMNSQAGSVKFLDEYSSLVGDALLMEEFERDIVMVDKIIQDFVGTGDENDLRLYSNALASGLHKLHAAQEHDHHEGRIALMMQIEAELQSYHDAVVELVGEVAYREGVIDSQLEPAAFRLKELMDWVAIDAQNRGDYFVAMELYQAEVALQTARVDMRDYLRTDNIELEKSAIMHMEEAKRFILDAERHMNPGPQLTAMKEAEQAIAFYEMRLEESIEHVAKRRDLIENSLNARAAAALATGKELIHTFDESLYETQSAAIGASVKSIFIAALISFCSVGVAVIGAITIIRSIRRSVANIAEGCEVLATGDLTKKIKVEHSEIGIAAYWMNQFVDSMNNLLGGVAKATGEVVSASNQIAASCEELSAGMDSQRSQSAQVSAAVEEMTASVAEVASKASEAASAATSSGEKAQQGGEIVNKTVSGIDSISEVVSESSAAVSELGARGEQIGEVIAVINDIADQTNLLALNAAIEAARAGEHGRGFAVVADEVRKLAERTTTATEEVASSITAIQGVTTTAVERMASGSEAVGEGVKLAGDAGESLSQIVRSSGDVAQMIQSIAAAAEQQNTSSNEISRNISAIAAVTSESAEAVQQSAHSATTLATKADQLNSIIAQFKLQRDVESTDAAA